MHHQKTFQEARNKAYRKLYTMFSSRAHCAHHSFNDLSPREYYHYPSLSVDVSAQLLVDVCHSVSIIVPAHLW